MNQHVLGELESWLSHQIIGQHDLVKKLLIALLADGHLLVEGAPGLAKTRAIKMMADGMEGDFHRVQFTPDLLPGDITGTDVFRPPRFILGDGNTEPYRAGRHLSATRGTVGSLLDARQGGLPQRRSGARHS